jgi:hypothetical protein
VPSAAIVLVQAHVPWIQLSRPCVGCMQDGTAEGSNVACQSYPALPHIDRRTANERLVAALLRLRKRMRPHLIRALNERVLVLCLRPARGSRELAAAWQLESV